VKNPDANEMTEELLEIEDVMDFEERRRGAAAQLLGGSASQAATIAAGVAAPTSGVLALDTEGGAATDDVAALASQPQVRDPGFHADRGLIVVRAAHPDRTVRVVSQAGVDGIDPSAGTVVLDDDRKVAVLARNRNGSRWREVLRTWGADHAARRAALGLGSFAALPDPVPGVDDGKVVTADAGAWIFTVPIDPGPGFEHWVVARRNDNHNLHNGENVRWGNVVASSDGYPGSALADGGGSLLVPTGAKFAHVAFGARIERRSPDAVDSDFVELSLRHYRTVFGTEFEFPTVGLCSRSFWYPPTSQAPRRDVGIVRAMSRMMRVTPGDRFVVTLTGIPGNAYRLLSRPDANIAAWWYK
jgi:hypothetical protein